MHSTRSFALLASSAALFAAMATTAAPAHADRNAARNNDYLADPFRQLEEVLPTPTATRAGSGAPGAGYWQQRADYDIRVEIDDERQRLIGSETIQYFNVSPDTLRYLWLQVDANIYSPNADAVVARSIPGFDRVPYRQLSQLFAREKFDGSAQITSVRSGKNKLKYTVVKTMMRVELPRPLLPGQSFTFSIDWNYNINPSKSVGGRTGFEHFEEDDNYLYEIAQWFPRMAVYDDVNGWQNKQFLGRGEFSLEFGNYTVRITVPADHVVASTGVLQNPAEVLTKAQRARLKRARTAKTPVFIVTPKEAKKNERSRAKRKKTWVFKAQNVRDFAFATSRKFIWDAVLHPVGTRKVWAMSYYPNEGEPLWSKYSTHAIVHTLDVYSKYTFDYPYPVAISVNGPVGGMEYPMICFNGPRPEKDGTYTKRTKYGLISVIIHEVGHNWFPMIVDSDERQWTWMDEGLNTFLQYLTEQEWEKDYPSRRGEPANIVKFMTSRNQVPIMTNSESLLQFGNNAYAKPATALNVLRETVIGRKNFDYAFKQYSNLWKFKRPMPADFFRLMEDASGVDLDWFWRGWFYTTLHTDIAINDVRLYTVDTEDPFREKGRLKIARDEEPVTLSKYRNRNLATRLNAFEELKDFYNEFDELDVTEQDRKAYAALIEGLESKEKELLRTERLFYVVDFENVGGLVMPIVLKVYYADGTSQKMRIPAEIWRHDSRTVSKLIMSNKEITRFEIDPNLETADGDTGNNHFPPRIEESRFKLYKKKKDRNPMQKALDADKPEVDRGDEPAPNEAGESPSGEAAPR